MKRIHGIFALAAMIFLAACSSGISPIDMLNRAQPVGSPYTKYLAHEYTVLANTNDGGKATYFAQKGLAAVDGMIVMPEPIDDNTMHSAEGTQMAEARGELISELENGGRDRAPDQAAIAQTRFDCWISHHDNFNDDTATFPGDKVPCKDQLHIAMAAMKTADNAAPPPNLPPPTDAASGASSEFPAPVTDDAKGVKVPLQQASFLVFFDWDKHNVSDSARGVIDSVTQEIKGRNDIRKIIIVGHTDTSGGEKYNQKLSVERANAVRDVLVAHGIAASKIHTEGHGKSDLLVKTPDNVREPQNRRAQITFE